MDYVDAYTGQYEKALKAFGQDRGAEDFVANNKIVPYTPKDYALGISRWYYEALDDLVTKLEDMACPRQVREQGELFGGTHPLCEGVHSDVAKKISDSKWSAMFDIQGQLEQRGVFPVSILANEAAKISFEDHGSLKTGLRDMADGAAKALAAMHGARTVENEHGIECLDPSSAVAFWEGWRAYAVGANQAEFKVDHPGFWWSLKESVKDLPENVKAAAEGAAELAGDALVYTGELAGRVGKGFLSGLGAYTGVLIGAGVYIGFKKGVF